MSPRKKKDEPGFEQRFVALEEIVDKMESGELTLQESIQAFERGMELYKLCSEELKAAEVKIKKLMPEPTADGGAE